MLKILKWSLVAVLLLCLVGGAAATSWIAPRAARLALRVACPTVFVEERSIDYATDKLRNLGLLPIDITRFVGLSADTRARVMSARVLGLVSYSATHIPGEGCVLQD